MTVAALLRRSRAHPLAPPLPAARRGVGAARVATPERLIPPARPAEPAGLPFADGSCDSVVVGHDLLDRGDATEVLVEWRRVLRPGGTLVVTLPPSEAASTEPGHDLGFATSSGHGLQASALERLVQGIGGFAEVSTRIPGPERSVCLRATKTSVAHAAQQG